MGPRRVKNFHFSMSSRHPIFSPEGTWVSFSGLKAQEREADHSPPTSV
jgi:hypothetical protein